MPSPTVCPKASGSTCADSARSRSASLRPAPGAIPRRVHRSKSPLVKYPHSRLARSFGIRSTAPSKPQPRPPTHQASKQTPEEEMGTRLFIGNLSYNVTEQELREAFTGEQIELRSVRVALDRDTGRPRGFAFVETATDDGAKASIEKLSGRMLQGRAIIVEEAQAKPMGPRPVGGAGFGGPRPGGFGGPPRPPGAGPAGPGGPPSGGGGF